MLYALAKKIVALSKNDPSDASLFDKSLINLSKFIVNKSMYFYGDNVNTANKGNRATELQQMNPKEPDNKQRSQSTTMPGASSTKSQARSWIEEGAHVLGENFVRINFEIEQKQGELVDSLAKRIKPAVDAVIDAVGYSARKIAPKIGKIEEVCSSVFQSSMSFFGVKPSPSTRMDNIRLESFSNKTNPKP